MLKLMKLLKGLSCWYRLLMGRDLAQMDGRL